jgi:F-type H+-transporting ATPase subunit b
MEILGNLGINGKIFLAQIVNFFLLMYILKRFLYKPLLNIMQEREKRIKEGLKNADKAEARILEIEAKSEKQLEKTTREADKILEKAHLEGEDHRKDLLRETQEEISRLKEDAKESLKKEKELIMLEIRKETGEIAIQIAQKIIQEKISSPEKRKLLKEAEEAMEQAA